MKKLILITLVFVFAFSVNAQTPIQEFNFNGTLSNSKNDVSFTGISTFVKDRTGTPNSALRVVNNALEATLLNLPLSNASRTVSIWIKYNDISTANYIWGYGGVLNAQYFGLLQQSTTTSKSDLNLAGWGPSNDVIVTTTIAAHTWYNYVATYDGLTSKIYRNGELIKSSISPRKLTSGLVFGIGKMGKAVSMNADIDDLKIYDVALSSEEVALLYNNSQVIASNEDIFGDKVAVVKTIKEVPKKALVKKTAVTPNPNIVLSTPKETVAPKISEIYSTQGLKVFTGNKNDIDITTLPEGTYLLKVSSSEQTSSGGKFTAN